MIPQNMSEIKFTMNEAQVRYQDSLIFENGLLIQNYALRYERKTLDMETLGKLKGVPAEKIQKYVATRNALFPKRKADYETRLQFSVPDKVRIYAANLRTAFGM